MGSALLSQELHDVIRYSMSATRWTSSSGDKSSRPEQNPQFQKLLDAVVFSHKLVLTYHVVILTAIFCVGLAYWSRKASRWQRFNKLQHPDTFGVSDAGFEGHESQSSFQECFTKESADIPPYTMSPSVLENDDEGGTSSGSSNTLESQRSYQKDLHLSEVTPLLRGDIYPKPPGGHGSILAWAKGLLLYQPRPIPLVNKTLPSNATTIVLAAFIGLNIFYIVFGISYNLWGVAVISLRAGLLFVANLPLLYLLAAKTQPLRILTGFSYESLNIFHRRLGEIMIVQATLHLLSILGVWYTFLKPTGTTLGHFLLIRVVILGITGYTSYVLLYITSLASFRQRWYELFLGSHVLLQTAALVLIFFHHRESRIYVGAALLIFLVDRLVYRFGLKSLTVMAQLDVMEDRKTVCLWTDIDLQPATVISRVLGHDIRKGWKAGDHVYVSVPSLSRKHLLQAHPFTISSPAPTAGATEAKLNLLIRAQDGFSADLLREAMRRNTLSIRLNGPYGSNHARDVIRNTDLSIFIAGGSGIAVCWPLVAYLAEKNQSIDPEIASMVQSRRQEIVLIWVIHKSSQQSWIRSQSLSDLRAKGVKVIIPQATEEIGRPDLDNLLDGFVKSANPGTRIGVVGSGPDSMGRTVRNACARLVRDGWDVDVNIEKFGW